jgi:tetratricopeptide (TPR) repeat protein
VLGAGLVALAFWGGSHLPPFDPEGTSEAAVAFMRLLGALLLAGLPFFYLLMVCGETDESEVEVAALCAALGFGLFCLRPLAQVDGAADKYVLLVPVALYFLYVTRLMPRLRVFKHTIRGYGYLSLGRVRDSLVSFGRALTLDRKNQLATSGLMELHRKVDVTTLEPETVRLLNFDFCLKLANEAVVGGTPTPEKRAEAMRLLELVEQYSPPLRPRVDYLKAVTLTHAKDFDLAAGYLQQLLDPTHPADPSNRHLVLFDAWHLALRLHPELVRRLGPPHLELAGRRIEAIAAVERQLAKTPDDPAVMELKTLVYSGLTEGEFLAAAAHGPPPDFNYEYAEQLGLALVDDNSPAQVDRGMAFLRTAGRGLPQRGPWIFTRLAQVAERLNDPDAARGYWEQVKRTGLVVGPQALPADQKALYFAGLDKLVADAVRRGEYAAAVADQRTILEGGREDVNTLRTLAELHAKNGDPLNALLITSRALILAKTDPDLLAKKDSYYYSVDPEKVRAVKEKIAPWFDVDFCLTKARKVADSKEPDLDTLDYGLHMARLARVMKPESHAAMVAEARVLLRRGERDKGLGLLEDVREQPKGNGEEEDAWYLATRILGDLYLNELQRPDLAVAAYTSYRGYHKSGAETLFQLALAHEAAGNAAAAIKCYEAVTGYKDHPRYWDANEAVRRLKGG